MLVQVRIAENKCLLPKLKVTNSDGRIFLPPVLAHSRHSVEDVEHTCCWAQHKEQELMRGACVLHMVAFRTWLLLDLVLNKIPGKKERKKIQPTELNSKYRFSPLPAPLPRKGGNPLMCSFRFLWRKR